MNDTIGQLIQNLENHKAESIEVIDVRHLTGVTDYMIICTARSHIHAKAVSKHFCDFSKEIGVRPAAIEGESDGEWILIDLSDYVVHIMLEATREFYSLEKLWDITKELHEPAD